MVADASVIDLDGDAAPTADKHSDYTTPNNKV